MKKEDEKKKTPDDNKDTFRLTDMVVTDVDIVDRAANKRRFLLLKREESMGGKNLLDAEEVVLEHRDGEVVAVSVSDPESEETEVTKNTDALEKGESMVCPKCSARMPRPPNMKSDTMHCPKCDGMMTPEKKSEKKEDETEKAAKPKVEQVYPDPKAPKSKCPDCGQLPCVCKEAKKAKEADPESDAKKKKEEEEKAAKKMVCPQCGYMGSEKECPKCKVAMVEKATKKPEEMTEEEKAKKKVEEKVVEEEKAKKKEEEAKLAEEEKAKGCKKPEDRKKEEELTEEEKAKGCKKPEDKKKEELTEEEKAKGCKKPEDEKMKKQKGIPKGVQESVLKTLREATERLMSVMAVLRSATTTQEQVDAPLPKSIVTELNAIGALIGQSLEKYPAPMTKAMSVSEALFNEKISAAKNLMETLTGLSKDQKTVNEVVSQINHILWSMADNVAVIAVAKSDGVETDPKSFLKASENMTIPAPVRDAILEKVRSMIERILSVMRSVREMPSTEEQMDKPMPDEAAKPLMEIVTEIGEIGKKYPSPSTKSEDVLSNLDKHFSAIREIVGNVVGSGMKVGEVLKSDSRLEKMESGIAAIMVKMGLVEPDQKAPKSNALSDEGKTETKKSVTAFRWPSDLAAEAKRK